MDYTEIEKCRLCGGEFFAGKLTLASTPPANEIYPSFESAINCDRFPLVLVVCQDCKHLQLKHTVSPERLFSNYVYKSGTSLVFREHFKNLAELISTESAPGSTVLELNEPVEGTNEPLLNALVSDHVPPRSAPTNSVFKFIAPEPLHTVIALSNPAFATDTILIV